MVSFEEQYFVYCCSGNCFLLGDRRHAAGAHPEGQGKFSTQGANCRAWVMQVWTPLEATQLAKEACLSVLVARFYLLVMPSIQFP